MRLIHLAVPAAGLMLAAGCAKTVSEADLRSAAKSTETDTLGRVLYLGRKDGYDYFELDWDGYFKDYRVKQDDNLVRKPMAYGSKPLYVGPFASDRWLP